MSKLLLSGKTQADRVAQADAGPKTPKHRAEVVWHVIGTQDTQSINVMSHVTDRLTVDGSSCKGLE